MCNLNSLRTILITLLAITADAAEVSETAQAGLPMSLGVALLPHPGRRLQQSSKSRGKGADKLQQGPKAKGVKDDEPLWPASEADTLPAAPTLAAPWSIPLPAQDVSGNDRCSSTCPRLCDALSMSANKLCQFRILVYRMGWTCAPAPSHACTLARPCYLDERCRQTSRCT